MKKLIKVTSLLSAVVLGAVSTGVGVANAANYADENGNTTSNTGTTTATVGLENDENAKVQLTTAPDFDFGSNKICGSALKLQATKVTDPITVVNPGLASGWNVTVSGTPFTTGTDGLTLNGAQLILNGVISSQDEGNASTNPTTQQVIINDQDQNIFTAAAGAGLGTWLNTFNSGDQSAQLNIPDGNQAGSYTSTLTWTLADTPSGSAE